MFARNDDQELFAETTRRFLDAECRPATLRALAGTKAGFDQQYWQRGAELGWTSLIVPEDAGGGSVSGDGVADLALLAYEFGHHSAPGPLLGANVVSAAVGRWGSDEQRRGPLADWMAGQAIPAWAYAEPPPDDGLGVVTARAINDGDMVVLSGVKSPVEAGAEANHALVVACHQHGSSQFLVPLDAPGVTVVPLDGLDLTRRAARIELDDVRVGVSSLVGAAGEAGPAVAWLMDLAVVIQLAEMVGAMQWAFDTTLDWTFNRYSFGRPLASYQEIKHRFADMAMWLEGGYAIAAAAATAVGADSPNRAETVSAGKFYIGRYGAELLQDCVQLHGGIGVTFDHDLHLFLRRVTTNVAMHGTPSQHAARIATILDIPEGQR